MLSKWLAPDLETVDLSGAVGASVGGDSAASWGGGELPGRIAPGHALALRAHDVARGARPRGRAPGRGGAVRAAGRAPGGGLARLAARGRLRLPGGAARPRGERGGLLLPGRPAA